MAKKLNKKVAFTALVIAALASAGVGVYGFRYLREKNPQYCLAKAEAAREAGDYDKAEAYYGKAYGRSEMDQDRIDILYDLADFHLINNSSHEPNWRKALACWNQVLTIEPKNITAHRKLLDYFYQYAENGSVDAWKYVQEHAGRIIDTQRDPNLAEPFILLADGRANLEIARSGSVAYRQEQLTKATEDFLTLQKKTPDDAYVYGYLAEAATVEGQLQEEKRMPKAVETAMDKAMAYLEKGLKTAGDKAAASVLMIRYKLVMAANDPNRIEPLRKEITALTERFPDNDKLWMLLSASYDRHAKTDRKTEYQEAIRAAEKATQTDPENVAYRIRLAMLMYRKATVYNEPQTADQAIDIAQKTLEMPAANVTSGPREGLARQNRFAAQSFLARAFFEKAIQGQSQGDQKELENWKKMAAGCVKEISQITGSAENINVMKWQGLMFLLDGRQDQAFGLLYKAYNQARSLDKPGELSQIDPYLCYQLAQMAGARGVPGAKQEFLEKAIFNHANIAAEIPAALLEYVAILIERRAGQQAEQLLNSYIQAYGTSAKIELMLAEAAMTAGKYEQARQRLEITGQDGPVLQHRLTLTNFELDRLSRQQDSQQPQDQDVQRKISLLRKEQLDLLARLLDNYPKLVDTRSFTAVCRDLIAQGQTQQAASIVDKFLDKNPKDSLALLMKKELQEPDPKNISGQRRAEMLEQILSSTEDPKARAVALGQYYRSSGDMKKAAEQFAKAWDIEPENMDIFGDLFGVTIDLPDVKSAESMFNRVRNKNPDGCQGNLCAAQLDIAKQQYDPALRRLDECLAANPILPAAHLLKSRVYILLQRFPEAVESAKTALTLDPMNGAIARQYASVIYDRNMRLGSKLTAEQTTEAQRAVGLAMLLNPGDWQIQSVYAETIGSEQPQQALAMRQKLLKNNANVTNAVMLGNMALRMAKIEPRDSERNALLELANSAYQQGCQIEPNNQMAMSAYADFLRQTNQKEKAEQLLAKDNKTLGRFYISDGQYEKARVLLEQALRDQPKDPDILRLLAEAAYGLGQREQVKYYLDQMNAGELTAEQEMWTYQKYLDAGYEGPVEQRLPDFQKRHPEEKKAILLQAWVKMTQGQVDEALKITRQYLELEPDYAPGWHLLGRLYRFNGQRRQAIEALQKSKSLLVDSTVRMELAALYVQDKQIETAVGELVTGLEDPQAPVQMRLLLEQIYTDRQRINDLKNFYLKTLDKYPQSVFWMNKAGLFYLGQKDYPPAISMLGKAWSLSESSGRPGKGILDSYLRAILASGKPETVISTASRYIDTDLAPVAYLHMALAQVRLGQNDKAMDYFQTAVQKAQSGSESLQTVLETMNNAIGEERMTNWCRQKLAQDRDFLPANLMLYIIYERQEQYNKALEHLDLCIAQTAGDSPQRTDFSLKRGNLLLTAYSKTSDESYLNQSIENMEKLLSLSPDNATIMNNLAYLLADTGRDTDKALDCARRAYRTAPDNLVFLDTLAYVNLRKGQYGYALQLLQRAVQQYEIDQQPVPWEVYKHLAMAFEGLDKNEQAITACENALKAGQEIPAREKENLNVKIQKLRINR